MTNNSLKKSKEIFNYNPMSVWLTGFILPCFFIFLLLIISLFAKKPTGIIFASILLCVGGFGIFKMLKSFVRYILKKPAIMLSEEYYIDYQTGVKIHWNEIKKIETYTYRQWTFLKIKLRNENSFFEKINNPFYRTILRIESFLSNSTFKTNISFVKGKNNDIYRKVCSYQRNFKDKSYT